jgi:DNA-binding HxlR family transcriptional regulator
VEHDDKRAWNICYAKKSLYFDYKSYICYTTEYMKRADNKSRCPINFTVEIFGDTWSMLIYRDMAALGKKTYGEFLESEERIGSSVLAERLVHLQQKGIICKTPGVQDKRKVLYSLTETGIRAVPILYEIATWGTHTSPNPKSATAWFAAMERDKQQVVDAWQRALRAGDSFFFGEQSVVNQLKLPQD